MDRQKTIANIRYDLDNLLGNLDRPLIAVHLCYSNNFHEE
jgi:hypothetical protein